MLLAGVGLLRLPDLFLRMSATAKAALESDTRTLAYEAGRKWGHRVNVISAGPYASRAASARESNSSGSR